MTSTQRGGIRDIRLQKMAAAALSGAVTLGLSATAFAAAGAASDDEANMKVLLLVGAFVLGLLLFVWLASKLMGPDKPADDDNPFIPLGIGDEEDRNAGDS